MSADEIRQASAPASSGLLGAFGGLMRRIFPGGPPAGEYGVDASQPVLVPYNPKPVPEPRATQHPQQTTAALGGTGVPIYSGFVTDLGEYNGKLQGRDAFETYEKMRRSDPDVRAGLQAIKLPIRVAQFQIVPGATVASPNHKFAQEIAEFVEENLFGGLETMTSTGFYQSQSFESVLENALLCPDYGCSAHEILWHVDQDKVRIRRLAPRLPLTFYRFWPDTDGETLLALEQYGYRGDEYINVLVPAEKIDFFNYDKEGANFYGRSILRAAYLPWYVKNQLYRIDAIGLERNAVGVPVIEMPENASEEDREFAFKFVTQLAAHEQTGIVTPFGFTLKIVGTTGRLRDPKTSIQHYSEQTLRSMLAQFLAFGTTQTGSRSLGSDMITFFKLGLNALARGITNTMSSSSIRRLVDYNYGDSRKDIPYPRLIHGNIVALDPLELADKIAKLMQWQTDLLQPDDELENWFRAEYNLPRKTKMRVRWMPVQTRLMEQPAADETPQELETGQKADPDDTVGPIHPVDEEQKQDEPGNKGKYDPGVEANPQRVMPDKVSPVSAKVQARDSRLFTEGKVGDAVFGILRLLSDKTAERTIAVDFDGVISIEGGEEPHVFRPGKFGNVSENARALLARLSKEGFRVVIFTARKDLDQVRAYLKKNNLTVDDVTNQKILAVAYIDDRGLHIDWGTKYDPELVEEVMAKLAAIERQHGE